MYYGKEILNNVWSRWIGDDMMSIFRYMFIVLSLWTSEQLDIVLIGDEHHIVSVMLCFSAVNS